ncbi:MAG: ATP-binding cassette domain-containing protein [Lachnospiraceae bacterium]|nr:ATP-binding cassette domain-containing protein [Lachnospiraceae bacterium]
MGEKLVELKNVTKKYKNTVAVNEVSLTLEKGKIYGLVGKNGAGKTTIMRMIMGLSIPTSGAVNVSVNGMGTLIEAPALNEGMSASENIRFYSMLSKNSLSANSQAKASNAGKTPYTADQLLKIVGLENTGKKKVKDFSLGMRQRLGIAIALVDKPDFVMLDEPINGLDPIGVVEIRKLIKESNEKENITFLISSHNLPELYNTATEFIIIDNGKMKKQISAEQLENEKNENLEEYFLSVIKEV